MSERFTGTMEEFVALRTFHFVDHPREEMQVDDVIVGESTYRRCNKCGLCLWFPYKQGDVLSKSYYPPPPSPLSDEDCMEGLIGGTKHTDGSRPA